MILYKYMPSDRFFTNFKFRFTPSEYLNDPRELVPDIRLKHPGAYVNHIVQRNFASTYFQLLLANPKMTHEEALKRCLNAASQFASTFDEAAKVKEIFETFMRVTNKNVGVLSLTESADNEVMWGNYANSHQGFLVGLDADGDFFKPKANDPRLCGELMNVQYTDVTPVVFVEPGKLEIPKELFFTKTTRWGYEREWRMIKHLKTADEIIGNIHLFEVPAETVKEVVFGMKVSPAIRFDIEKKVRTRAPHVIFKKGDFDHLSKFTIK